MSYNPGDLLLEECELIVALEYAKAAIESVDVQIAFLPPKEHPWSA